MMDFKKNINNISRLPEKKKLIYERIVNYTRKSILAAIGGLFVLLYGCGYGGAGETIIIGNAETRDTMDNAEILGTADSKDESDSGENPDTGITDTLIRVYVCGAVTEPCVVTLPLGSRAEDAVLEAGGFAEGAAAWAVNLADWVADGQMLYIPTEEEGEKLKGQDGKTDSGLVNINTADIAMLMTLPGIGESRAADIIAYREKNGAFISCEDIMKVAGIKTSVYGKICDKITVK